MANKKKLDFVNEGGVKNSLALEHGWLKEAAQGTVGPHVFGPPEARMMIQVTKYFGNTVEVIVSGPFHKSFVFEEAMPPNDGTNFVFDIGWGKGDVILTLFGQRVKVKPESEGRDLSDGHDPFNNSLFGSL